MPIKKTILNISNNPNKSFIQASFLEANKSQVDKAGLLFLLIEINNPDKISEKIAFIIKQLLEKNYYLNDNIFLTDQINILKIESIFESSLVKTNKELLEFLDREKINFNFETLNISVGLIYDDQIYFSNLGQNKSFLAKHGKDSFDISDINPEDEDYQTEELSAGKIFSSIISGEIPEKSYLIFTNASLSQYLLNEEFSKIIKDLKIEGATEQIKNYLNKINSYSNFSGLLIQNCGKQSSTNQVLEYYESDLNSAEKKTDKIMTTPGSINKSKLKKKINSIFDRIDFSKKINKAIKKMKPKKKERSDIDAINNPNKTSKIKIILSSLVLLLLGILIYNVSFKKTENQ